MTAHDQPIDDRQFIAERAGQTSYWSDLAREAATIEDDTLAAYAARKAATYACAFVDARDALLENEGGAR
jgi:hypothetical protein